MPSEPGFLGRNNCGEASFYDIGEQATAFVEVETKPPSVLPKAQIVKIDTDGAEVDILERHRRTIDVLLGDFFLVGGKVRHLHRGTLKYMHRRLF